MLGSEESSSSDQSTSKEKRPRRRMIPVMDPCLKIKTKERGIIINLSMTKYEVISDVAEELDWNIQYSLKKGDWDVMWVDHMIEPDTLIKMHFFQKISHFPGIHVLARKNLLGLSFMEMKKKFPDQYNFFPKTWLLPIDYPNLRQQVQKGAQQGQQKCFIVKPEADCQGKGIFLTFKTQDVENGKHYVVQQYIDQPFLVDGLKFDFRIYVLLCGISPLRLYFYEEGLARFATEKYCPPTKKNLNKQFMHLTNYAINKKNPKYVYNSSAKNMSTGHKRSMTSVFKNIQRRGFNVKSLKEKIYDVVVKTVILGQPLVSHQYKFAQPDDEYRNMCFHILGIDIMIDQLLNPIVLEVNHTPSFATDTPLDHFIKSNLIRDTLVLMNVNEETKREMIKKTNSYQRERITNAKRLVETEEKKQLIQEAQRKRDEYENQNMGRYTKIYPVDDSQKMQEYEQFMMHADKTYFSENNIIRSQIEQEKLKEKQKDKDKDKEKEKQKEKQKDKDKNFNSLSKKFLSKKNSLTQSPIKSASRPAHSFSQRQIEQGLKTKNSSAQFFVSDPKICTILNSNPISSAIQSSNIGSLNFNSSGFHNQEKTNTLNSKGYIKICKSINNDNDEPPSPNPCNRISLIKNLPKIEKSALLKNSTIEIAKGKYTSLRKKKLSDNKDDRRSIPKANDKKDNYLMGGSGNFLTPKIMRFDNYQEEELIESIIIKQKRGRASGGQGSSIGF